jgi:hypothetical protein
MANLGAIGSTIPSVSLMPLIRAPFPTYADRVVPPGALFSMLRRDGIFGGNVKTAGVNEPNVEVMVMWRPSMRLIARTRTDADGNWTLTGFDPTRAADYAIIYKDPATGAVYNDAIYSLVAPV